MNTLLSLIRLTGESFATVSGYRFFRVKEFKFNFHTFYRNLLKDRSERKKVIFINFLFKGRNLLIDKCER